MNHNEAKTFLETLFSDIWEKGNITNLDKYYASHIKGYFNSTPITYADIKNRVEYVVKHQKNRRIQLEDIIATDSKIAARFKYNFIDLHNNGEKSINTMLIYHIANNKITNIWIVSEEPIDYKAKP